MLSLPGIAQMNKSAGTTGIDSVNSNEIVNFIESGSSSDTIGETSIPALDNHQDAVRGEENFNYSGDGWHWFIGINIYPNELKIN